MSVQAEILSIPESIYVTFEPGDHTKYTFIITTGQYKPERYLTIARGDSGPPFSTYPYLKQDINKFMSTFPMLKETTPKNYDYTLQRSCCRDDGFIHYMQSHSMCESYTALAAVICAWRYFIMNGTRFKNLEVDYEYE